MSGRWKLLEQLNVAYQIGDKTSQGLLLLRWIDDRLETNEVGIWCDGTVEATLLMQASVHHWVLGILQKVQDLPLPILLQLMMSLRAFIMCQINILWHEGISVVEIRTTSLNVCPRREARVHPTPIRVLLGKGQRHPAYLGTFRIYSTLTYPVTEPLS